MSSQGKVLDVSITQDRIMDLFTSLDPKTERNIEKAAKRSLELEGNTDPRHIFTKAPKPKDNLLAPQSIRSDKIRKAIDNWDDRIFMQDMYHQYMRHMQRGTMLIQITFKTYLERVLIHMTEVLDDLRRKFFHGALTKSEYHFNRDLARLIEANIKKGVAKEGSRTILRGTAR